VIAVGVGASRDCPVGELEDLVAAGLADVGLAAAAVDLLATVDLKAAEPAILALLAAHGRPLRLYTAEALAVVDVPTPSATVARHVGTPSVAEAAALLAAGAGAELLLTKRRSAHATCAIARSTPPPPPPPAAGGAGGVGGPS
jgi:cobalamin biosynthesis protein CbiG